MTALTVISVIEKFLYTSNIIAINKLTVLHKIIEQEIVAQPLSRQRAVDWCKVRRDMLCEWSCESSPKSFPWKEGRVGWDGRHR